MYYYILNPSAGNSTINTIQDKLRSRLDELGIGGEFAKTTGPGDATKMAAAAITKGFNTIVAVGGDGTVNEVINGITRDKVAIGIIPIGRHNKLATHLGIVGWQQACEVLAARRLIGYNLMSAGQQYFLSECLITNSSQEVDIKTKAQPFVCRLRIDERYELESPFSAITIVNQKFKNPVLENKLHISINEVSVRPSLLRRLIKRTDKTPAIAGSHMLASRVIIDSSPPSSVSIDGKEAESTPVTIKLTDRQIRFISEKQSS
jgi:diacylglycerol kinase family enzyme